MWFMQCFKHNILLHICSLLSFPSLLFYYFRSGALFEFKIKTRNIGMTHFRRLTGFYVDHSVSALVFFLRVNNNEMFC